MSESSPRYDGAAYNRISALLFVLGASLRILFFFLSDNAGGDAAERLNLEAHFLLHPTFHVIFNLYPPGHFWLMGMLSEFVPNVVLAGRLLSLLLGIASLYFVWKLAQIMYGEAAAMLSLAVFALYSLHIGYSTTSSSEAPFVFFVIVALFFFFYHFHSRSNGFWYLALSGVVLSIAGSIRFEAWLLFGELFLVLVVLWAQDSERRNFTSAAKALLVFGFTGGFWSMAMMIHCWQVFHDPLYLITSTHERMVKVLAVSANSLGHELALIPVVLFITLSPLAFVAAIYGIKRSRRLTLPAALAAVTLVFVAVQIYEVLRGGFLVVARYTLTPGIMLAVIAGCGLQYLCAKAWPERPERAYAAVIVLLMLNLGAVLALSDIPSRFADRFAPISPRLRYSKRIGTVAAYLRGHMNPKDAIVIDDYNSESNIIADAAGVPLIHGRQAYLESANNNIGVDEYIRTEHPRFLVYSDDGRLRGSLPLPHACNQEANLDGAEFHCDFANPVYRVYELSYH